MKAMACQFGSTTHAWRRAVVGSARCGGAGQRRRRLGHREVEDAPKLGRAAGPKGHDWAGWDAGLKGFFRAKMREKGKMGCRIEFRIYSKIRDSNTFKPNLN
jgi:hypothetical protein